VFDLCLSCMSLVVVLCCSLVLSLVVLLCCLVWFVFCCCVALSCLVLSFVAFCLDRLTDRWIATLCLGRQLINKTYQRDVYSLTAYVSAL
jgi:hypothetical protein